MPRTKKAAQNSGGKRSLEDDDSSEQPAKKIALDTQNVESHNGEGKISKEKATSKSRPDQTVYDKTIAAQTPEELAARFTQAIKKHKGDLSTIELEDQSIPAKAFTDTTSFTKTRLVQNLASFLEEYTEGGSSELSTCDSASSPHTLLLTFSAIRAVDLLRAIRSYGNENSKLAKLFAKHMKLKESIEYVQKTKFGIGAGTPERIQKLIEEDVLKVDELKRVVIDGSYVDDKQTTIFNSKQGFPQTLSLLNLDKLKLRFFSGKTAILVF